MTSCSSARRRSVMLPPMRPSPIIPIFTSLASSGRRPRSHVLQSDPPDAAPALAERLEVARGLRLDEPAEAEVAIRNRQLLAEVVHDLDEDTRARAALVQLSRRVQVARPEPDGDRATDGAGPLDQRLEPLLARGVDVGEDRDVVLARLGVREQLVDVTLGGEVDRASTLEQRVGAVLGRLHVGLVEGVDPEDRARDGDGELPAEELLTQLVRVGKPRLVDLDVVALAAGSTGTSPLPCFPVDSASSCSTHSANPPGFSFNATLSRPSRQASASASPSSSPGLPSSSRHASRISSARSSRRMTSRPTSAAGTIPNGESAE